MRVRKSGHLFFIEAVSEENLKLIKDALENARTFHNDESKRYDVCSHLAVTTDYKLSREHQLEAIACRNRRDETQEMVNVIEGALV